MVQSSAITQKRTATLVVNPSTDPKYISFQEEVRSIAAFMDKAVIASPEDVKRITADLSIISTLKETIDLKRREYTTPLRKYERSINDLFASLKDPLDEAYKAGKQKILDYDQEVERTRLEAELKARSAAAAMAALTPSVPQVDSYTGEITDSPPPLPAPVLPDEPPRVVRTAMGSASKRLIPKVKVIDFAALADEYKIANQPLLNSMVEKGARAIRGCQIWMEPDIRIIRRK